MKKIVALTLGALLVTGGSALALTTQEVIDSFSAQGYTRVEVKSGPTQMKVEAIRGTEKVEVIYDSATGAVLKSETETVEAGDDTAPGIEVSTRNRDFLASNDSDDDDGRGHGRGRGGEDDDHDDDHGDDHGGHDGGDDHGGGDDD